MSQSTLHSSSSCFVSASVVHPLRTIVAIAFELPITCCRNGCDHFTNAKSGYRRSDGGSITTLPLTIYAEGPAENGRDISDERI